MKFGRARVQADGSLAYPKKGWEPPPPVGGYDRDPGNKWRFIPKWLKCMYRVRLMNVKQCGAVDILMMCQCIKAPTNRQQVHLRHCESCPWRAENATYNLG